MKIHHPLSEFIDRPDLELPMPVLDRIVEHHFIPVNQIAQSIPLRVHSCYRPKQHELERGRSGNSLHTFSTDRDDKGRGAIDISAKDMKALHELILRVMKPKRIAMYNTFLHVDYLGEGLRYFNSSWEQLSETEFMDLL